MKSLRASSIAGGQCTAAADARGPVVPLRRVAAANPAAWGVQLQSLLASRSSSSARQCVAAKVSSDAAPTTLEEDVVDGDDSRADEVRLMMAKAMNATVIRFSTPEYKTSPGNWLAIVGNVDELGNWTASKGPRMKWQPGHFWTCDVILPEHYSGTFEYKMVLMNDKGLCVWEPGTNRKLSVPDAFPAGQDKIINTSVHWGVREPELSPVEEDVSFADLEEIKLMAEAAADMMPGQNAAMVLLQAQQQLAESKRRHRHQVTELRGQLVHLQESSARETERVTNRMRELERAMEKIQARLDKERQVAEEHVSVLQARIKERVFARRTPRSSRAAASTEHTHTKASSAAAAAAPISAEVTAEQLVLEGHVMAILPHYSGLALERLHNMLANSAVTPKYTSSVEELQATLNRLVATGKLTADNGIYRFRSRSGTAAASRRASTPRPSTPRASAGNAVVVGAQLLELEPAVMSCMVSHTGISADRLLPMVLQASGPGTRLNMEQLTALLAHLEVQGKVHRDRGLYRCGKPASRVRAAASPRVLRGTEEAMPAPVSPARPRGRSFAGGESEVVAPSGSVAGGPPSGSVAGGPPAGWSTKSAAAGGSIMPSYDSTGAHPTLDAVASLEAPVLHCLSHFATGMTLEELYGTLQHDSSFSANQIELAAVLKNLTDQHKVSYKAGVYTWVKF